MFKHLERLCFIDIEKILKVYTVRTGNDVVFWCMLHVQQTPISSQPVQKDIKSCRTFIAT